jgi:hypothetical protein
MFSKRFNYFSEENKLCPFWMRWVNPFSQFRFSFFLLGNMNREKELITNGPLPWSLNK